MTSSINALEKLRGDVTRKTPISSTARRSCEHRRSHRSVAANVTLVPDNANKHCSEIDNTLIVIGAMTVPSYAEHGAITRLKTSVPSSACR